MLPILVLPLLGGCVARAEIPTPAAGVVVHANDAYEPVFYDDYVVYYDLSGEPYYYVGGGVVYVPRGDARYTALVTHYHTHSAAYARWHTHVSRSGSHIERREHLEHWQHSRERRR